MSLLTAQNIWKIFKKNQKSIQVLKGLDFSLEIGQKVAIVGASGVGKSTFLHILGGLDAPSSGKVFFDGKDIFQYSSNELAYFRNRNLGFVFQFHYLLPELSALENVMLPGLIAGIEKKQTLMNAMKFLEYVGLKDRISHRPFELSGGEQQRVAIARAVVMGPKLLLADEPTGNLDSSNREVILKLILNFNHVMKTAVLLVTHDLHLTAQMNRVLRMQDGVFIDANIQMG